MKWLALSLVTMSLVLLPLVAVAGGIDSCPRSIVAKDAKEIAERKMAELLGREGNHRYHVVQSKTGWVVHVDEQPWGPGRNKIIHVSKCGEVLKVEGGR